jgi:hypothetical protein
VLRLNDVQGYDAQQLFGLDLRSPLCSVERLIAHQRAGGHPGGPAE